MQKRYSEFRKLGCEVIAVSFASPEVAALSLEKSPLPFPLLTDPTKSLYQEFGLARTTWRSILRPAVIWRYVKLLCRGKWRRGSGKDQDVLQLGGDFILDAQRRLVYAHPSAEPTDRPSVDLLLEAVRRHKGDIDPFP